MGKRLMADGTTGAVAIMDNGSREAFTQPLKHMDKIQFHSDFAYLATVQQLEIPTQSFAAVKAKWSSYNTGKKKKHGHSVKFSPPNSGTNYYTLGAVLGDLDGPILGFVGSEPLANYMAYSYTSGSSMAMRSISVMVDNGQLKLAEAWFCQGVDLPAQTINNINIVKFNLLADSNTTSEYALRVTPSRFIAAKGKLDSAARYISRSASGNSTYGLIKGRSFDILAGHCRFAQVDGSYITENGYAGNWHADGVTKIDI